MIWITLGISGFYLILFTTLIIGWIRIKRFETDLTKVRFNTFISIIVPARNEEVHIERTLNDLMLQSYPQGLYEVIVIDDYSEDKTIHLSGLFMPAYMLKGVKLRILKMSDTSKKVNNSFKKAAIEEGIKNAKGDWIVTTDADSTREKKWLASIAYAIEHEEAVLISAPVKLKSKHNFFSVVQELEFMGLIGIGAAGIKNNMPNMCNGANLIFNKEAFYQTGGYQNIDHIASGDDELLMHKIAKKYPGKIIFLKSKDAIVKTYPVSGIADFIQQRKRWVSKTFHYKSYKLMAVLLGVYLFHVILLINGVKFIFSPEENLISFLVPLYIKVQLELLFLFIVAGFFGNRQKLIWYLPALPVHIIYVVLIGILGNFAGKYKWKGRTVK